MKLHPFFRHRWVRRLLWTLFTLVTLYLLAVQWINWRGARELRVAITEFESQGETLDFRAILHTPPPDGLNFCAIPALKDIADEEKGKANRDRLEGLVVAKERSAIRPSFSQGATLGRPVDLTAWARYLTEDDTISSGDAFVRIQQALEPDEGLIQSLLDALNRPEAAWTPSWKTRELPDNLFLVELPHYEGILNLTRTLLLLTLAEIQLGHGDRAHDLLRVQFRLIRASFEEPFLIGALVGATQLGMAETCLWEMARARLGSAEQFEGLHDELTRIDLRTALLQAYRTEATASVNAIMHVKTDAGLRESAVFVDGAPSDSWILGLVASFSFWSGLLDSNAAEVIRLEHEYLIRPLREGDSIMNEGRSGLEDAMAGGVKWYRPDRFIARLIVPSVNSVAERMSYAEGLLELGATVCRLEGEFARSGAYPEKLDCPPSSMRYERTASRYRLWLPGPDGEDDGGKRLFDPDNPEKTKFHAEDYQGDWVWDYPAES